MSLVALNLFLNLKEVEEAFGEYTDLFIEVFKEDAKKTGINVISEKDEKQQTKSFSL